MLFTLCTCVLLLTAAGSPQTSPEPDSVLARMDRAARAFQGMTAEVTQLTYTAVISDSSSESGSVRWRKVGANEIQGLLDFARPDHKDFLFKDHKLQIYTPSANTVQVLDLSHYGGQVEQFLMIGFGTPRSELEANYKVVVKDHPPLNGRATTRIELIPTSQEALKRITKLDLWIPDDAGYPIQEKVYERSGDTITLTYSGVKINPTPPLSDSDLKLNLPKGVQYIRP